MDNAICDGDSSNDRGQQNMAKGLSNGGIMGRVVLVLIAAWIVR